jgi:hypothetical protein
MAISGCFFVRVFKLKPKLVLFVIHLQLICDCVLCPVLFLVSSYGAFVSCRNWWFVLNSEGATSVSVAYIFSCKYWPTNRTSLWRLLFATNCQSLKNISTNYKTMACQEHAIDKKLNCTLTSLSEIKGMNCSIIWVPCMKHLYHSNSEWPIFRINSLMTSKRWCYFFRE